MPSLPGFFSQRSWRRFGTIQIRLRILVYITESDAYIIHFVLSILCQIIGRYMYTYSPFRFCFEIHSRQILIIKNLNLCERLYTCTYMQRNFVKGGGGSLVNKLTIRFVLNFQKMVCFAIYYYFVKNILVFQKNLSLKFDFLSMYL